MKEKIAPSTDEKADAARKLAQWLDMADHPDDAADVLRKALNEHVPDIEGAYAKRVSSKSGCLMLANDLLPRFVVDMMGVELFEGEHGKIIRDAIIKHVRVKKKRFLLQLMLSESWMDYRKGRKGFDDNAADKAVHILIDSKKTKWRPGGSFASKFVDLLGFPTIFEGITSEPMPGRKEEILPQTPYHKLQKYQENMKNQILKLLSAESEIKRAIVSLPTGAGKTKIAAEAIIEFWKKKAEFGRRDIRFVMWIAQNDELCEQAVACFKQIWEKKGHSGSQLDIFRAWNKTGLPYSDEEGIIIAGIDKIYSIVKKAQDYEGELGSDLKRLNERGLGAIFIDEAHRSWAPKYRRVLKEINIDIAPSSADNIPLIGLTATPERTAEGETEKLHTLYGNERIYPKSEYEPSLDKDGRPFDSVWANLNGMKNRLTEMEFLATPKYHYEDPGNYFKMTEEETAEFNQKKILATDFVRKIGIDSARNTATYNILKKWVKDEQRQVLFFGANIHQALLMSRFLEDDGIHSATITSKTRYGARKAYVRMFKEKEIQVLCNYEVLATGFDVPKIDTVVIARPTNSNIVYQQMVGRGLRGPEFNGTKTCDIITVEDKIRKNNQELVELGYMEYRKNLEEE